MSQVPHVKVMFSAAVERYKGRPIGAGAIASEINVEAVLVGKIG